jgi:hypothetical protein
MQVHDVLVDLVKCSLYGYCETACSAGPCLSRTHATDMAVNAVEQLRVLAVGDDEPPHKLRAVLVEAPQDGRARHLSVCVAQVDEEKVTVPLPLRPSL